MDPSFSFPVQLLLLFSLPFRFSFVFLSNYLVLCYLRLSFRAILLPETTTCALSRERLNQFALPLGRVLHMDGQFQNFQFRSPEMEFHSLGPPEK